MMKYFTYRINRNAVRLALYCFVFGSFILLIHLTKVTESTFGIGLIFTGLAIITNFIMLMILMIHLLINYKDFEENISTIIILLLNIPIARLYLNFIN